MKTSTRRQFFLYLGMGTYTLLGGFRGHAAPRRLCRSDKTIALPFAPISPSTEDRLVLPVGYEADIICRWGDSLGVSGPFGPETFGFDNDYLAFFPMSDFGERGKPHEGLLWVNHENSSPLFVAGRRHGGNPTPQEWRAESLAVGGSVLHLRREAGHWKRAEASKYVRRFTSLYPDIALSGPAAALLPVAKGTMANCSGGTTPWHTVLSCEERREEVRVPGISRRIRDWFRGAPEKINELEYGWVLEVDPSGELPPLKHTALGRFAHENVALSIGPSGRLVIYMGDDDARKCLYKYVSKDKYKPSAGRDEKRKLLTEGVLFVANFERGEWLPLELVRNKKLREAGFTSQAEILMHTRRAAVAAGGSPLNRPEGIQIHPLDGTVYVALSNNEKEGDYHGRIVRLIERGENPEGEAFRYEVFITGGPESGLSSPDNLIFDGKGNLWVTCDATANPKKRGPYGSLGNNGLFMIPTSGKCAGDAFQFASGPIASELTGPHFLRDGRTLFLSVQHPGSTTRDLTSPTSRWPGGGQDLPRPSVVAITGFPKS